MARRMAEARSRWGARRAGEWSEEQVAQLRHAMGESEEQASEWHMVGRAMGEGRNSEWSEAHGVRMGRTPVAKHYR
jgi:hypothetical protein